MVRNHRPLDVGIEETIVFYDASERGYLDAT